jgi:hypothetical protein
MLRPPRRIVSQFDASQLKIRSFAIEIKKTSIFTLNCLQHQIPSGPNGEAPNFSL